MVTRALVHQGSKRNATHVRTAMTTEKPDQTDASMRRQLDRERDYEREDRFQQQQQLTTTPAVDSDERIRQQVCEGLSRHVEIGKSEISVTVNNAEVTLRGRVDDRRKQRLA